MMHRHNLRKGVGKTVIIAGLLIVVVLAGIGLYYWMTISAPSAPRNLRIALAGKPVRLDPHEYMGTTDLHIDLNIYDNLGRYDVNGSMVPALATSWELVNDTTWRFHLRQGVEFHDGEPFNAEAVKYNWERMMRPEVRIHAYAVDWSGVTIEDEYTILLHTTKPSPGLYATICDVAPSMVSPKAIETYGEEEISYHPVGTGPFKFAEWVENEYIKLERNEDYWGGAPSIEEITFKIIPDPSTRLMALLAGEVDVAEQVPATTVREFEEKLDYDVLKFSGNRAIYIQLNALRPPLDDIRLREAINYAYDRDEICETILMGIDEPWTAVWNPICYYTLKPETLGPGGMYPFNLEKARELIAEAGWLDSDGDGILDKNGEPLKVEMVTTNGEYFGDREYAEAFMLRLKNLGFDVTLNVLEPGIQYLVSKAGDFDIGCLGGFGANPDPEPLFRAAFYYEESLGKAKYNSWCNITFNELLDAGLTEMNFEMRGTYYEEAQRIILEQAVIVPQHINRVVLITTANVAGIEHTTHMRLHEAYFE